MGWEWNCVIKVQRWIAVVYDRSFWEGVFFSADL